MPDPTVENSRGGGAGVGYAEAAELLSYLADRTRLRILRALAGGEMNVGELCRRVGTKQPSMSHHLSILRRTGILKTRRQGKAIYYGLAHAPGPAFVAVRLRSTSVSAVLDTAPQKSGRTT